jgi:hypothetical protein
MKTNQGSAGGACAAKSWPRLLGGFFFFRYRPATSERARGRLLQVQLPLGVSHDLFTRRNPMSNKLKHVKKLIMNHQTGHAQEAVEARYRNRQALERKSNRRTPNAKSISPQR